ncbi:MULTISPECIES: UPF0182 family protein [unclassified Bradyrhizobium]|uniref:UPF0182 family membrane protein n=1 Tax=unclassified Bradyrhizobium TaxID=2631580 RepID=UPI002478697B|nr:MULTISPECIES: UPF0182 family protein [unclassified Bradyrhizobium]WGS20566.1 UPF0182 family protein [Bradyrhizobium sp. ISRA463]WGS27453.1 UPF0182 family protein [Bradyrhizobium sp. ISRA464]
MATEPVRREWRWSKPPRNRDTGLAPQGSPRRWGLYLVLAILIGAILLEVPAYLQKWLWMRQLGYLEIFRTLLSVQWGMFFLGFVFAFLFFWSNLRQAIRSAFLLHGGFPTEDLGGPWGTATRNVRTQQYGLAWLRAAEIGTSGIVAWAFALAFSSNWNTYLRFRYGGDYGLRDPLFGIDIGFYLFHLPFYELEQHFLGYLAFVTLAAVVGVYIIGSSFQAIGGDLTSHTTRSAIRHTSALLLVLVALAGWEFYLDRYNLVYSTLGVVYGAGYAADHVTRIALMFMLGVSIASCLLLAISLFRPQMRTITTGTVAYVVLYSLSVLLLPAVVQHYVVQPNELALETPYLKRSIAFTRTAYGLEKVKDASYPALADLTSAAIARNQDTTGNIRLWDDRPLLQTYQQTQAIRLYYKFYNVSTDRYRLADGYHQVMLSTRELSSKLPSKAQTWVNERLQFTHGNGVVMNFVSKTAGDGVPQYILDNIPARSDFGLQVTRPEIYYGKSMRGYRIVATRVKEFDYPKGDDNVYTSYAGSGGVPLDNFWKRALFAWTQGDVNILLTSYLNPESRIQIWRRVRERVAQIAPFLRFDDDPYPVVSDGKLYWIEDAYTVSDYFPYSNPSRAPVQQSHVEARRGFAVNPGGHMVPPPTTAAEADTELTSGLNYIRNSVKVVIDMYNGTVRFYAMDPADPILAVYRRAFPGVFADLSKLSGDLKSHLRYPQGLFAIQADQYRLFHMTDPQVFYNQEDLWQFPNEHYEGETHFMQPYYVLMKLPGSERLEYLLMTPFTPPGRDNMIAWMAAKCDFPDYGKIIVFLLPKEKLIYGPSQVEAMIDQNTNISRQLSLWDQRGSHVIRGRQIVTPVENSFLYVEPIYLTATGIPFPQLKRVIVAADGKVTMAPTLDAALVDLFRPQQSATGPALTTGQSGNGRKQMSIDQARKALDQAKKALQLGNWEEFGKAMGALDRQLSTTSN